MALETPVLHNDSAFTQPLAISSLYEGKTIKQASNSCFDLWAEGLSTQFQTLKGVESAFPSFQSL